MQKNCSVFSFVFSWRSAVSMSWLCASSNNKQRRRENKTRAVPMYALFILHIKDSAQMCIGALFHASHKKRHTQIDNVAWHLCVEKSTIRTYQRFEFVDGDEVGCRCPKAWSTRSVNIVESEKATTVRVNMCVWTPEHTHIPIFGVQFELSEANFSGTTTTFRWWSWQISNTFDRIRIPGNMMKPDTKKPGMCKVHNARFYNLPPRAINCLAYNPEMFWMALTR